MTAFSRVAEELSASIGRMERWLWGVLESVERQAQPGSAEANRIEVTRARLDRMRKEIAAVRREMEDLSQSSQLDDPTAPPLIGLRIGRLDPIHRIKSTIDASDWGPLGV